MEKIVKGLDVDDVIAGFYLAMCIRYNVPVIPRDIWDGKDTCKFIADNMPEVSRDYRFWANLPIINSPDMLTFDFDYYVSSFPSEMAYARQEWLLKHGYPDKPLLCTTNKVQACNQYGINVLIDDSKSNIDKVNEAGIMGIWYRPWYMIEKGQDLDNLSLVDSHIESILLSK